MSKIEINKPENIIQCNLDSLPNDHKLHLTNGRKGKMIYDKGTDKDERAVLNEVHVYLSPGEQLSTGPFSFAIDKLNKIEVIEQDKVKTKNSYTVGTIVVVTGSLLFLLLGSALVFAASISVL